MIRTSFIPIPDIGLDNFVQHKEIHVNECVEYVNSSCRRHQVSSTVGKSSLSMCDSVCMYV